MLTRTRKVAHTLRGVRGTAFYYIIRGRGVQMDIATIGQLVGTLGFPIVACGACFWLVNKNEANRREDNARIEANRREDNAKITEALNNNTIALTKLVSKIGGE